MAVILRGWAALLVVFMVAVPGAHAASASFQARDLPDLIPGTDLWRFDIGFSGPFEPQSAIEFAFSFTDIGSFDFSAPSVGSAFEVASTPGLPAIQADGLLRFTATRPIGTESFETHVIAVRQGVIPAQLTFTVYDAQGDVSLIGVTTAVPEPPALLLWGGALALGALLRRRFA